MSLREQQSERSDGGTLEDQPESTPAIVDTEEGGDSEAQGESIGTLADPEEAIIDTVAADGAMLSTRDRIYNRLFGNGEQLAQIDRFNLIRRLGTGEHLQQGLTRFGWGVTRSEEPVGEAHRDRGLVDPASGGDHGTDTGD